MNYTPNGGQTYLPVQENIRIPFLPYDPPAKPDPLLPQLELTQEAVEQGYVLPSQKQHFLPGVTAQMMDWFWANMEKCYYLWAPGSHRSFRWVRSPGEVGFLKSSHLISETYLADGPIFGGSGMHIHRLDPAEVFPFTRCLSHVICEGTFNEKGELCDATIHMWQDTEGGLDHIDARVINTAAVEPPDFIAEMFRQDPEDAKIQLATDRSWHATYEAAMWPRFLPTLYGLWKDHPDRTQSVQCDLTAAWGEDGRLHYLAENGPAL